MRLQRQQWDAELPETVGQLRELALIVRLVRLSGAGHTSVKLGVRDAICHRIKPRLREAGLKRIPYRNGHDLRFARQAPQWHQMRFLKEVVEITDQKDTRTGARDSLQLFKEIAQAACARPIYRREAFSD